MAVLVNSKESSNKQLSYDSIYLIKDGSTGTENQKDNSNIPDTDTSSYLGISYPPTGNGQTWGLSLSVSDVESDDFGVKLTVKRSNSGGTQTFYLDDVEIIVAYAFGGSSTTAPKNPGTMTNVNSSSMSSVNWNNVQGIEEKYDESDASISSLAVGGVTDILVAKNFGFSIPQDAIIDGIEVDVNRYADNSDTIADFYIAISENGCSDLSDNKAETNQNTKFWPDSLDNRLYGANDDTWGLTLTRNDINNSNFAACLAATNEGGAASGAYVDYVEVTVTYHVPPPSPVLSATATSTTDIHLEWSISNADDVDTYTIHRGNNEQSINSVVAILQPTDLGFCDIPTHCELPDTVGSQDDYFYTVTANRNAPLEDTISNIASANTNTDKICDIQYSNSFVDCEPENAPNTGYVTLATNEGDIQWFRSVPTSSIPNAPSDITDWEFFEFRLTGISDSVTLTMIFSEPIPANSKFYKAVETAPGVYDIFDVTSDITSNDGDATVYFTIADNGPYDIDSADGVIEDPVGEIGRAHV